MKIYWYNNGGDVQRMKKLVSLCIMLVFFAGGCGVSNDNHSGSTKDDTEKMKQTRIDSKGQTAATADSPPDSGTSGANTQEQAAAGSDDSTDPIADAKKLFIMQKQAQQQEANDLEARHQEILKQGNIFDVTSLKEMVYLFDHTKYFTIIFYDNSCFERTQQSYNMIHNQDAFIKRIPDMIFADVLVTESPDLVKQFKINQTPFTVLVNKGRAVAGSPGFYSNDGLEKFMRKYLDITN